MATTTIPWGDGSGDNIYLTYPSASGNQTVEVTSDANTGDARTKVVTFTSGVGNITQSLTVNQAAGALPYTPIGYIQTDGVAYIDTSVKSRSPIASEVKVMIPSATECVVMGYGKFPTSSSDNPSGSCIFLFGRTTSDSSYRAAYSRGYRYLSTSNPSIQNSVTNLTPFVCRTRSASGSQGIYVQEYGETTWKSRTSNGSASLSTTGNIYVFRTNHSTPKACPSGTRVYYVQIFSDTSWETLLFDGVPCIYNEQYGLWDKVSNQFFGNAAGSGELTGQ